MYLAGCGGDDNVCTPTRKMDSGRVSRHLEQAMSSKKRRQRAARKLVLPIIAIAMMTTMMFMEAHERANQASLGSTLSAQRVDARLAP